MTLKQYINVKVSAQTAENTGELLPQNNKRSKFILSAALCKNIIQL